MERRQNHRDATLLNCLPFTHCMEQTDIESLSLTERVVLLGIADGSLDDETPVASWEIRDRFEPLLVEIDADVLSKPGEQEVMRALNTLAGEPFVHENTTDRSPSGKGRPKYELDTDPETVLDAVGADERLAGAVDAVRN